MSADTLPAGVCRFCTCTETTPCTSRCGWTDATRTLCTTCRGAEQIAESIVEVFRRVAESRSGGRLKLISAAWSDITSEQQQMLVMTCRATAEMIAESLLEGMDEDAILAVTELNVIGDWLTTTCPRELLEDEPVSAAVIRLLTPHVGSRILLPGGAAL